MATISETINKVNQSRVVTHVKAQTRKISDRGYAVTFGVLTVAGITVMAVLPQTQFAVLIPVMVAGGLFVNSIINLIARK